MQAYLLFKITMNWPLEALIDEAGATETIHDVIVTAAIGEDDSVQQTLAITALLDTDCDTDPNITDLDDDNDQILDTDEDIDAQGNNDVDGDGKINSMIWTPTAMVLMTKSKPMQMRIMTVSQTF